MLLGYAVNVIAHIIKQLIDITHLLFGSVGYKYVGVVNLSNRVIVPGQVICRINGVIRFNLHSGFAHRFKVMDTALK